MRLLTLTTSIVLTGCATQATPPPAYVSPIEGVWVGVLESHFVNALGEPDEPSVEDILISVCGANAVLWIRPKDGSFRRNSPALLVTSHLNMHRLGLFHKADGNPPGWAEQQTYTLIAYSRGEAKLQWSRAVTNPLAEPSWPHRFFMGYGIADMQRTQEICDPQLMK